MSLYLIRCALDTRALLAFANRQGLLHRRVDDQGYVLHAGLAAVFGSGVLAPFVAEDALDPPRRLENDEPTQYVLAYAEYPIDELASRANEANSGLVRWDRSESKPMPELAGERILGFITRVTPTQRSRSPGPGETGGGRGHQREVDAFLAAVSREPEAVLDRTEVYRQWLERELTAERGGQPSPAALVDYSLRRFERTRTLRKEQGGTRARRIVERPDVVVSGALRVRDAAAFRALLRRGLGRHRAFGFGMLLLRRA